MISGDVNLFYERCSVDGCTETNLTESQNSTSCNCVVWQPQDVVFRPVFLRIGDRNGRRIEGGERSAICGLCRGARRSTWRCRSPGADARLRRGAVDADRAQKRRTDGGSDSPVGLQPTGLTRGAGRREASIPASFCWKRAVVGRGDAGQGGRTGAPGARAQRAGRPGSSTIPTFPRRGGTGSG